MDAELRFWIVTLVVTLLMMFVVLPLVNRHLENKDAKRLLGNRSFEEYHDDMEDR
jgi:uncharacterized membrane protein